MAPEIHIYSEVDLGQPRGNLEDDIKDRFKEETEVCGGGLGGGGWNVRSRILAELPESNLTPVTAAELADLLKRYPDLPEHLRQLFTIVGIGSIGDGRYMIHGVLDPKGVYDEATARTLEGIVLVGDDFAGTCEAYDTTRGWQFGSVGVSCEFEESDGDFVGFLERWYGRPAAG